MDLDLTEPVVDFLEEKRELYKQVAKEAVYNKGYLGTDNFIVADTITAPGQGIHIELFDLMQITDTHVYLYHVKEGFSQKTRDACSQVRVAAKALRKVKGTSLSKSILEGFWQDAVESDFSSYKEEERKYREAVKKSLLKLGSDPANAKKAFFNLFLDGKRKVCFVYAFVDDAVTERKLEDETTRVLRFAEKDFGKLKNPKEVYAQLHHIGVLKDGQLDRSFFDQNPYFETSEMDTDVKAQVLEIFRKKMSAFESNIAKIELLHLEKELVHNLGFEFGICQIYRPPRSGSTVFSELPDFLELDLFPPEIHVSRTFHFEGQDFEFLKTLGDGACGLHALLGIDVRGTVQYEDHLDCGTRVKAEFVKRLRAQITDPRIQALLGGLLIWMLDDGLKKKSVHDNIVAVIRKGPINVKEIEKRRQQVEKAKQKIKEEMAKRFKRCLVVNISDYRAECLHILEISEENLASFVADLQRVFNICEERRDLLFSLFNRHGQGRSVNPFERDDFETLRYAERDILALVERRENVDQLYRNFRLERLMKPEFLAHYFKCLVSLDYFHYTDELHIAAILFGKTVHLFHKQDGKIARQVLNDGAGIPVLIHHEGMHFSRCLAKSVVDPAPALVVEEEDFYDDSADGIRFIKQRAR
ncbi:MAG: hypothetical protein K940chlam8_00807 [Chlamydiae bacterium]|nr:hypothetical protein [Chlamydiota bacterium]